MSLVEINEIPNLNLRVYKRGSRRLVLLWNRLDKIEDKQLCITAKPLTVPGQKFQIRDFTLDAGDKKEQFQGEVGTSLSPDQKVVICAIDEEACGLKDKEQYLISVSYEANGLRYAGADLKVTGAGIYPPHDREDRDKNTHNFLWDEKGQTWRKQCGVMHEGKFITAVMVIPCPSCGYDASKGVRS